MTETSLPGVTPITCQRELSFTEFTRVITELMERDRVLEEAVLAFTDEAYLQNTVKVLAAAQLILGQDLVDAVVAAGQLPVGFSNFATFEADTENRLISLEGLANITSTDPDVSPRSVKSVVEGMQTTLTAVADQVTAFGEQLAEIAALTSDLVAVKTSIDTLAKRVTDLEALTASMSDELRNARKEYASDPSKRLVDKINSMDSISTSLRQKVDALTKEVTDARSADRYDTLAEHIGDIESTIEAFQDTLNSLQGAGSVNSLRVGRSMLHGDVELVPGSNIAITRERNGFRIDVVDVGSVVDLGAPRIDPNNCCTPGTPSFGN